MQEEPYMTCICLFMNFGDSFFGGSVNAFIMARVNIVVMQPIIAKSNRSTPLMRDKTKTPIQVQSAMLFSIADVFNFQEVKIIIDLRFKLFYPVFMMSGL